MGNRFIVYTLFPQANISLRVHWGPSREHVAAAVGHSIFNRTSRTNVGELMSRYGGGGHQGAGTCLLPAAERRRADRRDDRHHEEGRLRAPLTRPRCLEPLLREAGPRGRRGSRRMRGRA